MAMAFDGADHDPTTPLMRSGSPSGAQIGYRATSSSHPINDDVNDERHESRAGEPLLVKRGPKQGRLRSLISSNTGLFLIICAQFFFSMMNVSVQQLGKLNEPVGTLQLIVVRMAITWVCSVAYMLYSGIQHPVIGPPDVRILLAFRGMSGFLGLFGIYFSLKYLSLSDATTLTFLVPLFSGFSGALFLGEMFGRREVAASLFSFVGVIFIARPTFIFGKQIDRLSVGSRIAFYLCKLSSTSDWVIAAIGTVTPEQRLLAVGAALAGVMGSVGAYTSIRAIGKRAHALHSMASFSGQCVLFAGFGMILQRAPFVIPARLDWIVMLIMIGIFGFVAQMLLTLGLQREAVGRGSMAIYSQIVFATFWEKLFFGTTPSLLSLFGTVIIVGSAIYLALMKERDKQMQNAEGKGGVAGAMEEGLLERNDQEN